MNRIIIDSLSIISAGYDEKHNLMELEFKCGELYQYFDVPEYMYEGLLNTRSKIIFFNEFIKDAYRSCKIPSGT